jgi:hypothetical protein
METTVGKLEPQWIVLVGSGRIPPDNLRKAGRRKAVSILARSLGTIAEFVLQC